MEQMSTLNEKPIFGRFKYLNVFTFFNIIMEVKMVSITLSVPEEVRKKMKEFPEVNWSAFIRKEIEEKVGALSWKEKMLKELEEEKESIQWAVNLQRMSRKGRLNELKKKGLI